MMHWTAFFIVDSLWQLGLLAFIVFLAGIVRGCIGFGFSALVVGSGALFLSPSALVAILVLMEIVASVQMLPSARPHVRWRELKIFCVAIMISTPVGVALLSLAAPDTLRLILSLIILLMALTFLSGYRYKGPLTTKVLGGVGLVSGVFNGVAAVGGMPVAIFMASSTFSILEMRATMVAFFIVTEIMFLISAAFSDLYNWSVVNTALLMCVPMMLGIVVGSRLFNSLNEAFLRRVVLVVLIGLAILGVYRALA